MGRTFISFWNGLQALPNVSHEDNCTHTLPNMAISCHFHRPTPHPGHMVRNRRTWHRVQTRRVVGGGAAAWWAPLGGAVGAAWCGGRGLVARWEPLGGEVRGVGRRVAPSVAPWAPLGAAGAAWWRSGRPLVALWEPLGGAVGRRGAPWSSFGRVGAWAAMAPGGSHCREHRGHH